MRRTSLACCFVVLVVCSPIFAQSFVLDLPDQSPRASVSQRVGLSDITIKYHRPLVNKRKVFPGLVPYGEVWRAGANFNTIIEVSDPVTVEGQPLVKGVYGLHMIPTADSWTVIFSKQAEAWGSFTYDQKEDALRVNVKPQPTDMHEALEYTITPVGTDSAVVRLAWEKTAVPFTLKFDVNQIALEKIHQQMRGLQRFGWQGWNDAAGYLGTNKIALEEALDYADRSIQIEERFDNLQTKITILTAMNKMDAVPPVQKRALELASPLQMHNYARGLQIAGKQAEAFEIFRSNAQKNPTNWVTHVGLARVYSGEGKFDQALKEIDIAAAGAPAPQKQPMEALKKRLERKEDINK
jgi:tetratricopeptide (TPR) repeat protein